MGFVYAATVGVHALRRAWKARIVFRELLVRLNATHHEGGMQNMSDEHTSKIAPSGNVAIGSTATA